MKLPTAQQVGKGFGMFVLFMAIYSRAKKAFPAAARVVEG